MIRRVVWADDADDLDSQLNYDLERVDDDVDDDDGGGGLSWSARHLLAALRAGEELTTKELGDKMAADGRPLRRETLAKALKELAKADLAVGRGGFDPAHPWLWQLVDDEPFRTVGPGF